MKFCSNCGREIRRFEKKCPECGNSHDSLSKYFDIDDNFEEYFNNKYIEDKENTNFENNFKTVGKYKFFAHPNENKKFDYSKPIVDKTLSQQKIFKIIHNILFVIFIIFILSYLISF